MHKRSNTVARSSSAWLLAMQMTLVPAAFAVEPVQAPEAVKAPDSVLDPDAVAALDGMGSALRKLDHFTVKTTASIDVVLETGQKIQLDEHATYRAQRPNGLFVELGSDRKLRQLFFDGNSLTVFAPRLGYFGTAKTRARTLSELVDNAAKQYGVSFPLADLFYWGADEKHQPQLTSALYIGPAWIDGEKTDQYAFRQPGTDWQIWLTSETRLPRQVVITNVDDPAMPAFRARLDWDTRTEIPASTFQFHAPPDAVAIELAVPKPTR